MSNIKVKTILVHLADGRSDYYARREPLIREEIKSIDWLRNSNLEIIESPILHSVEEIRTFTDSVRCSGGQSIIVHIPIWANPIFTIMLHNMIDLPILLLGNDRPETSSIVGLLGAGGALDQIGVDHHRVFECNTEESKKEVLAFVRATAAIKLLRGQTLGLFGGRSLGIFTAGADTAQWQKLFGVDIEILDQSEIVKLAEQIPNKEVSSHFEWMVGKVAGVEYDGNFTPQALEKQIRSYLATKALAKQYGFDFVGVKCQPELSDGYVTQCVSHCLMNSLYDADGAKEAFIHACESDADGALSMQILHLVSAGQPSGLLDMRWFNSETQTWVLANCGAISSAFFANKDDPTGLNQLRIVPHVFGNGGGGALPGVILPAQVTLARLCRKDGKYWMAIILGKTIKINPEDLAKTTSAFPQAYVKANTDNEFLQRFGSNHIHIVYGDYTQELIFFCKQIGIPFQIWK